MSKVIEKRVLKEIEAQGGGGRGDNFDSEDGGGGGSGFYFRNMVFPVTLGETLTIIVCGGGNGATQTTNSTNGGLSQVIGMSATINGAGGSRFNSGGNGGQQGNPTTATSYVFGTTTVIGRTTAGPFGEDGGGAAAFVFVSGEGPGMGGASPNTTISSPTSGENGIGYGYGGVVVEDPTLLSKTELTEEMKHRDM